MIDNFELFCFTGLFFLGLGQQAFKETCCVELIFCFAGAFFVIAEERVKLNPTTVDTNILTPFLILSIITW